MENPKKHEISEIMKKFDEAMISSISVNEQFYPSGPNGVINRKQTSLTVIYDARWPSK